MKNYKKIISFFSLTLLLSTACKKEKQPAVTEEEDNELLTTCKLTITRTDSMQDVQTAVWKKLNPNDASLPDTSLAHFSLKSNRKYQVEIAILDETKSPAESINAVIIERSDEHLFCFTPSSGLNLSVKRLDYDTRTPQLELGLKNEFSAGTVSQGFLQIQLRHQPNVKNGDCGPGSTDMDVSFRVTIQ